MILVDSGFFLALSRPRDELHPRAIAWANQVSDVLLVTESVLLETVNALSAPNARSRAHAIVDSVLSNPKYSFVRSSPELFAAALTLHRSRPDKEWSLTDCVSFHIMNERGISQALAHDIHFEQAGFDPLLRRDPV